MNKIFLYLFLLILIIFPNKAFSLTYDKKTVTGWADGKAIKSDNEGFFGTTSSCSRSGDGKNYILIQGSIISYIDGGVRDFQKGIFDCRISKDSQIRSSITEGLVEFTKPYEIQIYFKIQNNTQSVYRKKDGIWYLATKNASYADWSDLRANFASRLANNIEEKEAEKLYYFYKNLDLSSPSAKIYGGKIFNIETSNISSVSKTSASSVKQSKLPNCVGSYSEKTWTNCYGIYKWSNPSDRYEGEYLNGKRHGFGTYIYANGNKYSGEYKNDSPNGRGTITFSSGEKYIGEVKNGKRHGTGTYFFTDGERLTGNWNENEYVDAKNYRKVENENSNFTKKTKSTESTKLKTSSSIKEYWWVLILLIGVIFFVYTQTKKDLSLTSERVFRPRVRESKNFITSFFNGQESLGFSFWIMYSLLTLINFFLFSILDDYSSKQNLGGLIPGIFAWIVVGCYIFSSIGTWRSATNYKLQKIRIRETFGWANIIYVVIVATSIFLGIGFIQGVLETI
jgi:hypothetical protein